MKGITGGIIAEHQKVFGILAADKAADKLAVQGWGHVDAKGRVSPGAGRTVRRDYTPDEKEAIRKGSQAIGVEEARSLALLGRPPIDVYLNRTTYWRCVPTGVWDFFIGGYQVLKKWLSYREETILNRSLTKDEAREVTAIVRRTAGIVLLTDRLDRNYEAGRDAADPWTIDEQHH